MVLLTLKNNKMKKLITTIIFALIFGLNLSAQSDGFFSYNNIDNNRNGNSDWSIVPSLPSSHGFDFDQSAAPAPLGSGLLILGGLSIFYAKRKKSN